MTSSPRSCWRRSLLWATIAWVAVRLGTAWDEAVPGEALAWRWARLLADHPLRGIAGLALILAACTGSASGACSGGQGSGKHPS